MQLNGAQMVTEALRHEGVKVVFGYPGGAALNIFDEVYKQDAYELILTRHEQAAVHAADGYARAIGKCGVAFVTSGPGFTNAVTGLATAYADSIPLVLISGQVTLGLIGTDAFQEIDAVGISRPCVKHNFLVKTIDELPRVLKQAFYIAKSGRPGPVHVDIPKDITAAVGKFEYPAKIKMQTYRPTIDGHPLQIKKAKEAILAAKKPVAYIGGGAISSWGDLEVRKFIANTKIPAVLTLMALGVLRSDDALNLGMVGMHGSYRANMALSEADLIICLGARFDDRVTGKLSEFGKNAKIIHIDIDPSSIGKIVQAHYPIVGDLKSVIKELNAQLVGETIDTSGWREQIALYERLHPLTYTDENGAVVGASASNSNLGAGTGANSGANLNNDSAEASNSNLNNGSENGANSSNSNLTAEGENSASANAADNSTNNSTRDTATRAAADNSADNPATPPRPLKPQWVVQRTAQLAGDETIIATDVGQHQMWVAQFFPFVRARQLLTSGGLGTMGYGLPAAMGAAWAAREGAARDGRAERTVIAFSGDGGVLMNIQELMTLSANSKRVINIILNNNFLGMVRQWQSFFYGERFSSTVLAAQPDFVKLAQAFGCDGYSVATRGEFDAALRAALASAHSSVIEVKVERFENVLPMVPAGGALYNMRFN